jgi:predicted RNA-binding protein Jag
MKSLIEEASTIGKAIEKAWERAGKPQSFSIKVCEKPEYGFLGMTKKYGKVVIFFEDISDQSQHTKNFKQPHQEKKIEKGVRQNDKNKKLKTNESIKNELIHTQPALPKNSKDKAYSNTHTREDSLKSKEFPKKHVQEYTWTNQMVEYVKELITQTVQLLGRNDITFNLKNEQQNLIVVFNGLLVHEPNKEHAFYKHFAYILITALRAKFKTEFKYLRLVLSRE